MEQGYVTINLGGQELKLRAGDNPDKIKALGEYVDSKLQEVTGGQGSVTLRVALLAALNIAEELQREREMHDELISRLQAKAKALRDRLSGLEESDG